MTRPPSTDRRAPDTPVTITAWGATVAWLVISAVVFFGMAGGDAGLDPLRVMMVPVAVFGPVALVWIAAFLTRRVSALTRAVDRLERAAGGPDLSRRLDAVADGQERLRAVLAGPDDGIGPDPSSASPRSATGDADTAADADPTAGQSRVDRGPPASAPAVRPSEQAGRAHPHGSHPESAEPDPTPRLDLPEEQGEKHPLDSGTLIGALQFPADAEDEAGFDALRRAMRDPVAKPVVTAAQDMLTLLSELDLYMDDVVPAPAGAEAWRRFAAGERSADVAEVGGERAPEAEDRIAGRLRTDPIFRDAAHHFVRLFDRLLARRAPGMSDVELEALSATRSARAFALLGRSLGTFESR